MINTNLSNNIVGVNINKSQENIKVIDKDIKQLNKVEQIKEDLKNGTYKVDLDKSAEKMIENLIN